MHVAIDMDKMRVLNVHRVQDILHGLVQLEAANVKNVKFENTDSPYFLAGLKVLQMQLLYTSVTGEPGLALTHAERRASLTVVIGAMKPPLVDDQELDKQIASVEAQLKLPVGKVPFYRYALGSRTPKTVDDILPRTLQMTDAMRSAAKGAATALQPLPAATIPAPRPAGVARQPAGTPRPAGAEPTGGVAGEIWMVADKMWKEAGSPKDTKVVLKLRMTMMEVLETQHDIKRTTASNTLGQWMKARLS